MSESLVHAQPPEEREYDRYLGEVEVRKRRAAELRAELESLKHALGRFEIEYHARVGSLFVELDRVRVSIEEYERRIALLQSNANADPATVEQEVGAEFAHRREEVHAEEEEARRFKQAYREEQELPRLATNDEVEIKRLYRDLAKSHHPDLAQTEEDRRRREVTMQRVNAAFRSRDLDALRAILQEAEADDPGFEARPLGEKLIWAIREVARLDGVIADLEAQIANLLASDTFSLWSRAETGEPVIAALETDLQTEIRATRERLAVLVTTYRQILEEQPR